MNQDAIGLALAQVMPAARQTGLFVSRCTIQYPSGSFGPSGAPDANWQDVPGLVNLPCMSPPPAAERIQADEVRALEEITAMELHHVLLDAWYPTLDEGWRGEDPDSTGAWRAVVDGVAYIIMGVESDSQSQMTRVTVKLSTE